MRPYAVPSCLRSTMIATIGHKLAAHKLYVTPIQIMTGKVGRLVKAKVKCMQHKLTLAKKTHWLLYPMLSIMKPRKGEMMALTVYGMAT